MIEGTNTTIGITDDEFKQFADHINDTETTFGVIENLEKRRENVLKGGVNCIPLPFERFRSEIPGIEQGQYVLITANQKVSCLFI